MSRSEWFLSLALLLLFCGSASGVELNYTWKKGDIHRFDYQDVTEFDMKMGGMPGMAMMGGMKTVLTTKSTFSEKVLEVRLAVLFNVL